MQVQVCDKMIKADRLYKWDNIKFFSILCIVLLHSTMPYAMDGSRVFRYVQPFINLYPMTMFAIISGFWYKDKTIKQLFVSLLLPCILFSIINDVIGYYSHFPKFVFNFKYKAGYAMWYLLALFIYSLFTRLVKKHFGVIWYFLVVLILAVTIGFIPVPNRYLDIQRISSLFPSYAFGVFLKEKYGDRLSKGCSSRKVLIICLSVIAVCVTSNLAMIHFRPDWIKYDRLVSYYGLNYHAALVKWFMCLLRVIVCVCVIICFPNKKYWYSVYGTRTLNVYLLHMIPVFLLSWGILYPFRYEWWGVISLVIVVPLLCTMFLSERVDRFMKKLLLFNTVKL